MVNESFRLLYIWFWTVICAPRNNIYFNTNTAIKYNYLFYIPCKYRTYKTNFVTAVQDFVWIIYKNGAKSVWAEANVILHNLWRAEMKTTHTGNKCSAFYTQRDKCRTPNIFAIYFFFFSLSGVFVVLCAFLSVYLCSDRRVCQSLREHFQCT